MNPSRSGFHTCSRGFTLIEMIVASAVLVLIAGALSSILAQSQHSYQSQQYILEVTQEARAAMDQVCAYLRQAGNDPEDYLKDNSIPPIELLGTDHIRINSDITGSVPATGGDPLEATGDPDGSLDNLYERVELRYYPSLENLRLDIGHGSEVLAENLTFDLTFFDINGNETAVENDIVRVRVEMVAETEDIDLQTGKIHSITLESEVMLRSQSFDLFAN